MLSHFHTISLTSDQTKAIVGIETFLNDNCQVFILKGYAGSGKTTLLKGIVEFLSSQKRKCYLMAPTGRAAKVINQKTKWDATTIHKAIYSFDELEEIEITEEDGGKSFKYFFKLRNDSDIYNSIIIVDEASMVSDKLSEGEFFRFGTGFLLHDLVTFTRVQNPGSKTKIIFVGDPAQLPPIGMDFSPALDEKYLIETFSIQVQSAELKEIKRQTGESGILKAAGRIRKCLTSGFFNDFDLQGNSADIINLNYQDFINVYNDSTRHKIIIAHKNKTALDINQSIRKNKYGDELPIQPGDQIIIAGNNYKIGVMNGEFGIVITSGLTTITRRINFIKKGNIHCEIELQWRWVELLFPDESENGKIVKGYMLENYVYGDNYITPDEQQALYVDFKNRHPGLKAKTPELKDAIIKDLFFSPILLKFGYAVTCHKAQGGEWDEAFVFWDRGIKDGFNFYEDEHSTIGKTNEDFYRWAYTAITRASKTLRCINPPYFTSFSNLSFIPVNVQNAFTDLTGNEICSEELLLKREEQLALDSLGLTEAAIPLQDHFLKLRFLAGKKMIDIIKWKKVGYEIHYYFGRLSETAAIKFWINGSNDFRSSFQMIPSGTNSEKLCVELAGQLNFLGSVFIKRDTHDQILSRIQFEIELEESKPYLKILFDRIDEICNDKKVEIETIEHHSWVERYHFKRGNERAIIDFQYNKKGFFTRVLPINTHCNSDLLLNDVASIVNLLQKPVYVI